MHQLSMVPIAAGIYVLRLDPEDFSITRNIGSKSDYNKMFEENFFFVTNINYQFNY